MLKLAPAVCVYRKVAGMNEMVRLASIEIKRLFASSEKVITVKG